MLTKKGTKRLKKIFDKYEDSCDEVGISDFNHIRGLYYIIAIVVEHIEKHQLPIKDDQVTITTKLPNDTLVSPAQAEPMEIEISENTEHQSEVVIPETITKNSDISQMTSKAKAQTITPPVYTPRGKRTVTYAEMTSRNLGAGSKRDISPSPVVPRTKFDSNKRKTGETSKIQHTGKEKKQDKQPPKQIFSVITGYTPERQENIRDITIYDIPSTWTQLDILQHLKLWGHVIAMKTKSQKKYSTVTISIDLNDRAMELWNGGTWMAPLGGLPV